MSKKFIIEISKLDPAGVPTLDQWVNRAFIGTCMASMVIERQSYDGWREAGFRIDGEVAELATEIDEDWRNGLEPVLGYEMVAHAIETAWSGVIVFELLPYGRNGSLVFTAPRQFYIFRIGSDLALYSTDSITDAFSAARKLAQGMALDGIKCRSLPVPAANRPSSTREI